MVVVSVALCLPLLPLAEQGLFLRCALACDFSGILSSYFPQEALCPYYNRTYAVATRALPEII